MLEKEYEYFLSIIESLLKEHLNEFVVIKDKKIIGFFKTEADALEAMVSHEIGTFLVQKCLPEIEVIQKFHSRVIFA